ncbi:slit homolog 2 protein-like isoform X2 [Mytilus californianus]|uniref:slit homolog 2 protein-like isoform X2 n=1 Tax=Mytilus californianus TaxID=6549 RepID=UPI00224696C8|nr:slit homolog 2 protein-like isoform X2 [Mytilus californianus]
MLSTVTVILFISFVKGDLVIGCVQPCICFGTSVNCTLKNLTEIPPNIPSDTTELYLNGNNLTSLVPNDLSGLTFLIVLDLSENNLESLPKGLLSSNTNLRVLDLSDNNIISLSKDLLSTTTNLNSLYLNDNNIISLPEGLLSMTTELQSLQLDNNKLVSLPEGLLSTTTKLVILFLRNNNLESLPEGLLSTTTKFQLLNISGNALKCCLMKNVIKRLTTVNFVIGTCEDFNTTTEITSFNTSDCRIPLDGGWSPWFNSSCSVTCGDGVLSKNRTCDNPTPSDGGLYCVGSETETSFCNLGKCRSESCNHSK